MGLLQDRPRNHVALFDVDRAGFVLSFGIRIQIPDRDVELRGNRPDQGVERPAPQSGPIARPTKAEQQVVPALGAEIERKVSGHRTTPLLKRGCRFLQSRNQIADVVEHRLVRTTAAVNQNDASSGFARPSVSFRDCHRDRRDTCSARPRHRDR